MSVGCAVTAPGGRACRSIATMLVLLALYTLLTDPPDPTRAGGVVATLTRLGNTARLAGRYENAEQYLERALAISDAFRSAPVFRQPPPPMSWPSPTRISGGTRGRPHCMTGCSPNGPQCSVPPQVAAVQHNLAVSPMPAATTRPPNPQRAAPCNCTPAITVSGTRPWPPTSQSARDPSVMVTPGYDSPCGVGRRSGGTRSKVGGSPVGVGDFP